jgi:hypothetical protein
MHDDHTLQNVYAQHICCLWRSIFVFQLSSGVSMDTMSPETPFSLFGRRLKDIVNREYAEDLLRFSPPEG